MASEGRRWHLLERLGAGAFGEVYLAEQDSGAGFRRRVALKVLHPQVASIAEAGRRMRDEARILGRLSHRNIVTVIDLVRLGDQWAVVMDYIPGADLDRVLETLEKTTGTFPAPAAFEVGAAVAEAIDAAFTTDDGKGGTLGVVHRDIKPSNVLITRDGDVKVLDFGVARVNMDTRESRTGLRVGTERYMSPQRICGDDDDLAGDVYALGATVAELVLGKPIGRTPVDDVKHGVFVESTLAEVRPFLHGPTNVVDVAIDLLRRMLDADAALRPAPRIVADQLAQLAKRLEGGSLAAFARLTVPKVEEVLGNTREPVSGVLSERSFDRVGGPTLQPVTTGGGRDPSNATVPVEAPEPEPQDRPSRVPPFAVIGGAAAVVATLVVAGAVALAIGYTQLFPGEAPTEPVTAAVELPVEAPVAAPEPTPDVPDAIVEAPPEAPVAPAPTPEPAPAAKARPVKPAPIATAAVEAAVAPPPSDAPRVSRALVVMQEASALEVRCGDVTARGTASVRITSFPAGSCVVKATWLGRELSTTVSVDRPREVACTAAGDVLSCP